MTIEQLFTEDAIAKMKEIEARISYLERLQSGLTSGANMDFFFSVAAGLEDGYSKVSKFGRASGVGTTLQPVTITGFYRTPTTATALEVVSSSANDTSGGSGARQIVIEGLNGSWQAISQTVNLNGTAAVSIPTSMTRVYRIYVSESGTYATTTTPSHNSTITIRETGAGPTWAQIPLAATGFGAGQSSIGAYSIETGKTALVYIDDIFVDSTKRTDLIFFRRDNIDTVAAPFSAMRIVEEILGISEEVAFNQTVPFGPFVGPCDIGFLTELQSGSGGDVSVNFDIVLYNT